MNETEVREIIKQLEKQRWEFQGYDASNYEFLFKREDNTWLDFVSLNYCGLGTSRRRKSNDFEFKFEPFTFDGLELPLFYKLYEYMQETREGLPLDMAKNQKKLDAMFQWQFGETYCYYEDGVLSCGIIEEDDD